MPDVTPLRVVDSITELGPQCGFCTSGMMLAAQAYIDRAWAGALTLIVIVMVLNLGARLISRFAQRNSR